MQFPPYMEREKFRVLLESHFCDTENCRAAILEGGMNGNVNREGWHVVTGGDVEREDIVKLQFS